MYNDEQIAIIEANLKAVTDKLTVLDNILKAAHLGMDMVLAFQCGESGLYYPADYVKNWGKEWGIGLGPHPVSESLQSEYDVAPPAITPETQDITQIMHPLRNSCVQMDMVTVLQERYQANRAVPAKGDEKMTRRAPILYNRQVANPRGRLGMVRGAWAQTGRNL